jgi:phosphatidate cytidylyltransferase
LRENLVANINRLFYGFILIVISFLFFYLNLDFFFFTTLVILIFLDLFKSKIFSKDKQSLFLLLLFIIFLFFNFFGYLKLDYLIFSFLILNIINLFFKKYSNVLFILSLYIFLIIFIKTLSFDRNLIFLTIFISFFNDTIAYLAGRNIGGPLILPLISPKKTWSGTLISFLFSFLVLLFLDVGIIFSLILSSSLFFGDLYFSLIKRRLKIKDFSQLLGQHGGILDRLDSMFYFLILLNFPIYFNV